MSLPRASLAVLLASATFGVGQAQPLPRSFEASPDVYRVIAQNEQFKVISVTWQPGQKDLLHAHPASAVYYLTDCSLRIHAQDGTFRDVKPTAGMAIVQNPIPAHILENIGVSECRLVMVEPA